MTSFHRNRLYILYAFSRYCVQRSGRIVHGEMFSHVEVSIPVVNTNLLTCGSSHEVPFAIAQLRADFFA